MAYLSDPCWLLLPDPRYDPRKLQDALKVFLLPVGTLCREKPEWSCEVDWYCFGVSANGSKILRGVRCKDTQVASLCVTPMCHTALVIS